MKEIKWRMYNLEKLIYKHVFVFCAIVILVVGFFLIALANKQHEKLAEQSEIPQPVATSKPTNQPDVESFKQRSSQATKLDDSQMKEIIKQINKELNK